MHGIPAGTVVIGTLFGTLRGCSRMVPDAHRALPEAPRRCILSSNMNQEAEAEAREERERERERERGRRKARGREKEGGGEGLYTS